MVFRINVKWILIWIFYPMVSSSNIVKVLGFREHHGHMSKPRFLPTQTNFTFHRGETATLYCSVADLGTKTPGGSPYVVTWRRSKYVLTVGEMTFAAGKEYEVIRTSRESPAWNLIIKNVQPRHADTYQCQVSTADKMTRFVRLSVLDIEEQESDIQISGPVHIDKGLTIRLECNATGPDTPPDAIDWFKNGNKLESNDDGNVQITKSYSYSTKRITSVLLISNSKMDDTGTYTCRTSDQVTSVAVNILNAEKPRMVRAEENQHHQTTPTSGASTLYPHSSGVLNLTLLLLVVIVTQLHVSLSNHR